MKALLHSSINNTNNNNNNNNTNNNNNNNNTFLELKPVTLTFIYLKSVLILSFLYLGHPRGKFSVKVFENIPTNFPSGYTVCLT